MWQAWVRIRRRTPAGFAGPSPITLEAIDAFIRRTGLRLDPRDVELIEDIDDLYLAKMAEEAAERDKQRALKEDMMRAGERGRKAGGRRRNGPPPGM